MAPRDVRDQLLLRCLAFLRYRLTSLQPLSCEDLTLEPMSDGRLDAAARLLADHLGLSSLRCSVIEALIRPHHGGRTELWFGQRDITIEISRTARETSPSALCVLAHELSRKVLYDRGVHHEDLLHETLTDVAAVFLGFGKLLLNGYEHRSRHPGATGEMIGGHAHFGYLSPHEVAFTHAAVCNMRRASHDDLTLGLSPFAHQIMNDVLSHPHLTNCLSNVHMLAPRLTYR